MAIFKNITDIKNSSDDSSFDAANHYLSYCKKKIEDFLYALENDPQDILDRFEGKYTKAELDRNKGVEKLFIINHVKDIKYCQDDIIEVIFGVEDLNKDNSVRILLNNNLYYNILDCLLFWTEVFSYRIREQTLGIKRGTYKFRFKIDVSGTNMFNAILKLTSSEYYFSFLSGQKSRDNFNDFCRLIEEFFINYNKFTDMLWIDSWTGEDLSVLSRLGKIVKAKKILITDSDELKHIDDESYFLLPWLKTIAIPGARVHLEKFSFCKIADIEEIKKHYPVFTH